MALATGFPPETPSRPYEESFREIMEALASLQKRFERNVRVDRELMSALWNICFAARRRAAHPYDGAESTDPARDPARLAMWLDTIAYTIEHLLAGDPINPRLLLRIALEPDYAGVKTW
jgi:hypothetical protein